MATWPMRQALERDRIVTPPGVVRAMQTRDLARTLERDAPGIPVFADSLVAYYVDLYGERHRDQFRAMLGLADHYHPLIEARLAQAGLPKELALLPMALSGMNTLAGSQQGQAGLWMLSWPVAVRQGLVVTAEEDHRRDPMLATLAAVADMERTYARLKDPVLALVAVACGPANMERARVRSGGARDLATLSRHVDPAQRDILPLFMAFLHLAAHAQEFGIRPMAVEPVEPFDTLRHDHPLHMDVVAGLLGHPRARLEALNPVWYANKWPAHATIHLPQGDRDRFQLLVDSMVRLEERNLQLAERTVTPGEDRVDRLPDGREAIHYRVRPGDHLSGIGERFGVRVSEIKHWNKLRNDHIDVGELLKLYVTPARRARYEGENDGPPVTNEAPDAPSATFTWYTVRKGDSLYAIAKRHPGVSPEDLMRYNGISDGIRPGQRIKIPAQR